MDFGLGLVLSFTDNATSGINNAVNSLSQLTYTAEYSAKSLEKMTSLYSLSVISDQFGSSFMSAGGTIISTLGQVIGKVNETGQTLMYAENQLDALYANSGKTGKQVIGEIQDYAKKSMFEFENLIPAVTSLKSVGIEAFDSITSSTGNAQHSLLDYASALASFAPQMKNAYGTGINAAIGSMREYIAEGNAMSLKRGAGLDITGILGEDKGATIEERTRQVADLIETLGMMPMVEAMSNSPMTKLSNMGDTLFQFAGMVANSGVYDAISNLITIFADFVGSIDEARLESIAKTVGSALASLIKPIEWLAKKIVSLADGLFNLLENNPSIAKFIIIGSALAGVLLLLTGVALKVTSAFSGLSLMLLSSGKSFKNIGGMMKSGVLKLIGTMLPLIAVAGLLAFAWKKDLGGLKTNVTKFLKGLSESFKLAKQSVGGSVQDLSTTLTNLRNKGDFFSNLTIGIMKVMTLVKALADVWNDNTLSEDLFLKAQELGILPLIENILDLKYRFGFFKDGFIAGWNDIINNIRTSLAGFSASVEGTFLESIVDSLTSFLEKLASGDTQAWYEFGESFADFTAGAIVIFGIVKAMGSLYKILTPIVSLIQGVTKLDILGKLGKVGTGIKNIITVLKGGQGVTFLSKLVEAIKAVIVGGMKLKDALSIVFGSVATTVAGIVSFVSGIVLAFVGFFKQLKDGFSWFWEILKWVGLILAGVGAVLLEICGGWVATLVVAIVGILTTLIVLIKDHWAEICAFFSAVGTWIYDNVIKPVADFFVNLWNGIVTGVENCINGIKNFFSTVASWIYNNVIFPVVNFFMTYIFPIIAKIVEIVLKIGEIIGALIKAFVMWLKTTLIDPIIAFFVDLWNKIVTGVTTFINTVSLLIRGCIAVIKDIINSIVDWINTHIITPIATFFSNLWNGIVEGVTAFIEKVKVIFTAVRDWINEHIITPISEFFAGLWEGIKTAFDVVADTISSVLKGAVNTVLQFICNVINGVIKGINWAIDVINAIPGVSIEKITLLSLPKLAQGGIVDSPTTALIGEDGAEAVMPLENNLGWIEGLASMLVAKMTGNLVPANTSMTTNNSQGDNNQKYLTSNNTSNTTYEGDTDNSIIFNEGAIQVVVPSASDEEAYRLAKKILEYIKRQKELDRMMCYA